MALWELKELSTTGKMPEDCVPLSEKAQDYLNIGLGLIFFLKKSFNLYPNSSKQDGFVSLLDNQTSCIRRPICTKQKQKTNSSFAD